MVSLLGSASAANLSGRVLLSGKDAQTASVADTIVYFQPERALPYEPLPVAEMRMERKAFRPRVLVTTVGSRVRFPNQDPILHNAFSSSEPNVFDMGLYGAGESREFLFQHAGLVRVFCNVHYHMVGLVMVLDTPFFTRVDESGNFVLENLPDQSGILVVWHERAAEWRHQLTVEAKEPLEVELPITKRRIPQHKNKFGRSYRKLGGGRDY